MNKVNSDDLDWNETESAGFVIARKKLALAAGSEKLGASLFKLPAGKAAFPYHLHHANEEAIFVLQGHGLLRLGDNELALAPHDYVALRCGEAHQVINNSTAELQYLCISTMIAPDVMEYPDSGKIGIMSGSAPGGAKVSGSFSGFYRCDSNVDYYDGEDGSGVK